MKKTILAYAATIASSAVITATALAGTTATVKTSKKQTAFQKFMKKSSLGYYSQYTGPGLKHLDQYRQVGAATWTQFKFTHNLTDATSVYVAHAFQVNQEDLDSDNEAQKQYQLDDFRLGVQKWDSYAKNIRYRNRMRIESPSTDFGEVKAHKNYRMWVSHTVSATFKDLHNVSFFGGLYRWFYNQQKAQDAASQYNAYISLSYSYSITDKLSLYVSHGFIQSHMQADPDEKTDKSLNYNEKVWQSAYLGTYYTFSPKLTLGTLLYMRGDGGSDGMTLDDRTQLQLQISGRLF